MLIKSLRFHLVLRYVDGKELMRVIEKIIFREMINLQQGHY